MGAVLFTLLRVDFHPCQGAR